MFKKFLVSTGISLFIFSAVYADTFSISEINFNDQVMNIMSHVEDKSITQNNIDEYLNQVDVSNDVKQAVKANVLNKVKYSDYHKVADGMYLCNKINKANDGTRDAKCMYSASAGWHCMYSRGSTCRFDTGRTCTP